MSKIGIGIAVGVGVLIAAVWVCSASLWAQADLKRPAEVKLIVGESATSP